MNDVGMSAEELSAALLALEVDRTGDPEAAHAAAVGYEKRALALGDEHLLMRARLWQVAMRVRTGDVAGVDGQLGEIMDSATRCGDRLLQARTHILFATIRWISGDAAKFLEHSLSGVELLDDTAPAVLRISHRVTLADALAFTGDMDSARLRYRQAESLAREANEWNRLVLLLNNWSYAEYKIGDFVRAGQVAHRMVDLAATHDIELVPGLLHTIGDIQAANGEYAEAERTLQTCLARHEAGEVDEINDLPYYLLSLAQVQRALGATDRAQDSLDACRVLCTQSDQQGLLLRVHEEQAELHAARGDFAAAYAAQKTFRTASEGLRSPSREAQVLARHVEFETAEARTAAERFREEARRDPLTGLHNRRYVDEVLPALIAADPGLTVAITDIDHFKKINDELSHDTGDQVLVQVAKLLENGLAVAAPDGFVARLGGEEFLLVLPATPVAEAAARVDGIRQAISEHDWQGSTRGRSVTVSMGVAGAGETSPPSPAGAMSTADRNLYVAKRQGRNRVVAGLPPEPRPRACDVD
ncbi:GGDEF domain-containing protein [Krasilnikovia cinnamomea]|uniref:GGDEF domain-containing protein n=1 Tax=Krasilnikovia cinnamomea TaxID=349313 RepID=UPI001F5E7B7D|nr:GGDEF domain-containing protein [Krasilnikovia cinnamomea]